MTEAPAPPADITVGGAGLLCVTFLLRLRARIADAAAGTVAHVIAADPAAPLDLPPGATNRVSDSVPRDSPMAP
ncbi:sulfurtransferase TusA family protein [Streptomyces poriferorum]|uniref:sulfurtransferase TusA family protein n=1 Tax=Streptomyces poriferorum TaxID=2798799 RepID=UPI001F44FE95|nr:sulfurtransferase TusA family protein [Streptomyces poriferorum]